MPYFGVPIRNGLPIGLGSQAGFGIAPFDPRDLFSAGEQGAWYDPSDLTTLFTDSAGTTPVTGVEQFVGLMLDKSKGAPTTLGAELVVNGDFATDTWWSKGADWTIGGGVASHVAGASFSNLFRNALLTIGKTYKITLDVVSISGGNLLVFAGGANFTTVSTPGSKSFILTCAGDTSFYLQAQASTVVSIDNVSIRELPGNHATSTGTKRPKLAARYNLLTYTEQFDNAAWTKTNGAVTANAVVAPDGTTTADLFVPNTTNGEHRVRQDTTATNVTGTLSVYAKSAGYGVVWMSVDGGSNYLWFNLTNQTVGGPGGGTGTITDAGNGWYRCSYTRVTGAASNANFIWVSASTAALTFAGDGTSGVYLWGADLRPTSQATGLIGPTYQRVAAATDYDTVGFLPYLAFDGVDDSMSTGSIDFTATDKMTVWAGVRKLSDATTGTVFETSATYSGNNGSFALFSAYAANTHAVTARGSTGNGEAVVSTFTAPITNVVSGSINLALNIVSSVLNVRVNGVVPSTAYTPTPGSAMGVGNFGNYPLFIGQRNNTNFPFNGWLSSLIIRGAQSTDSQISATESWVNGRTGAY